MIANWFQVEIRSRTKLLQFHQDHRPAYWGTWSKTSRQVTGRRPLGKDTSGALNYDYDSEGTRRYDTRIMLLSSL